MPGADLQSTPTLNQAKWAVTQLVRFYNGLLQKLGGWQNNGAPPVIGTCRALTAWADLAGNAYVATGTEQRLQVLVGGSPVDITPLAATTNNAVNFSTTINTVVVQIVDTHAPSQGDWVNLITQVSVGGLVLVGFYRVLTAGSGHYTVNGGARAAATVTNGGAVPTFQTLTIGQPTVKVIFANHGQTTTPASSFDVPLTVTVGGVTLSGQYVVQSVIDANTFTINAAMSATSVAGPVSLNSGNAQIEYLLPTGRAVNTANQGYGVGLYGVGFYGAPNSNATPVVTPLTVWSLDHYGQDLIACPNGGPVYYWQPGQTGPAEVVPSTPPLYNNWIISVSAVQMVMALG